MEKNSNEHNELDELTPTEFVLVRTSSLFFSCSSTYRRFIADSVVDQLCDSLFQNKFVNSIFYFLCGDIHTPKFLHYLYRTEIPAHGARSFMRRKFSCSLAIDRKSHLS